MYAVFRIVFLFLIILYGLVWIDIDLDDVREAIRGDSAVEETTIGFTDDVFDTCRLMEIPTWNDELRRILHPNADPMRSCNRSYRPWTHLDSDGRVRLSPERNRTDITCSARAVLHKGEYAITTKEWHNLEEEYVFENDIVEVKCERGDSTAYHFMHTQVWIQDRRQLNESLASLVEENVQDVLEKSIDDQPPNVYLIVIDSIGASHGRRVFPKTIDYLKQEYGAFDIRHMNKVGENSRPNGMAFLFGTETFVNGLFNALRSLVVREQRNNARNEETIERGKSIFNVKRDIFGLPSLEPDWSREEFCKSYLDDKGFIMKDFEKMGYKTLMAEDWNLGVFNWPNCWGFKRQPTTHYMRPFQIRLLKQKPQTMIQHMRNGKCYEDHIWLNEYLEKFMGTYPDSPKMGMTWASYLGHDNADKPFHADNYYREFFERNKEQMENSFVFFMGDHGLRFGKLRWTEVGRRDVSNPMLFMSIPKRLRNDVTLRTNLDKNAGELQTMFDLHATFVDILESFTTGASPDFSETVVTKELKGTSLLRPHPPGKRNCKTLPIPVQYCLCEIEKEKLNVTKEYDGIARAIAIAVNAKLHDENATEICSDFEPVKVTEILHIKGSKLYEATAELRPSHGKFQAFVRDMSEEPNFHDFLVVVPDVVRLDKYGNQADCTQRNDIRPLCYCKSNLTKKKTSTPFPRPSKKMFKGRRRRRSASLYDTMISN